MMFVIPTWRVTIESQKATWDDPVRVPETNLDAFLQVLTFNKYEFRIEREREEVELDA